MLASTLAEEASTPFFRFSQWLGAWRLAHFLPRILEAGLIWVVRVGCAKKVAPIPLLTGRFGLTSVHACVEFIAFATTIMLNHARRAA